MTNPCYIGLIRYHRKHLYQGKHEPIVDVERFERVRAMRKSRHRVPRSKRRPARVYPLSAIAHCAKCGYTFRGIWNYKRCYRDAGPATRKIDCGRTFVAADELEEQIVDILANLKLPDNWKQQLAIYYSGAKDEDELENERRKLAMRKERLRDVYADGLMTKARYEAELAEIRGQEQRLDEAALRPPLIWAG